MRKQKRIWKWLAAMTCLFVIFGAGCGESGVPTDAGDGNDSSSTVGGNDSSSTDGGEVMQTQNWEEDGVLKILTIGNSFSCDTMEWMYQIAQSAGVQKLYLGNLDSSGFSLTNHLAYANEARHIYHTNSNGTWSVQQNYPLADAVSSQNWDFISFQQSSGNSGQPNTYDCLPDLMAIVRDLCPRAKFVWNMTWAYQADSTHSAFATYYNNQATMYSAIVRTVQLKIVPNEDIEIIAPTGTAIQNARTSYLGDTLTRDGYHLKYDIGRYIAGLTFFHALTGIDISKVQYAPTGVDSSMYRVAIESAKNAVKTPYEVTPSQYTK